MSLKKLNNKQVEIITEKYDIYIEKNKYGFILDYFKNQGKAADKAHVASESHEEFITLEKFLKRLDVESEDIVGLQKAFNLT